MRRAAGHALCAGPFAAPVFTDAAGGFFQRAYLGGISVGHGTSRSFRLAHKGPPPLQPFCVVRTGRRGFTSALRARRFERHIDIAAHPRGLPIIRSDFSLAPLILIAAPRPGQFRSCDTLPNRKFQSDLSFCKSRRAFER